MKKISIKLIVFAVISLFLTANIFAQTTKTTSGEKKPIIPKVIKVDDQSIKSILKPNGKPLLVNFWATWCVPCREEFPELVELDKEYKGKINFITISLDDLAEINRDVPKFLTEMKATMPAYLLRTNDENAVISSISKDWTGGLPFTVLYNEKGEVVHTRQGKIKVNFVKEKINELFVETVQSENLPSNDSIYPSDKYNYEKGIKDAENDISEGLFMILKYGLSPGSAASTRTLKDKYNIKTINYGCIVTNNLLEYIKGYNEISKSEIKRRYNLDL